MLFESLLSGEHALHGFPPGGGRSTLFSFRSQKAEWVFTMAEPLPYSKNVI
jgi:hypothetical protein